MRLKYALFGVVGFLVFSSTGSTQSSPVKEKETAVTRAPQWTVPEQKRIRLLIDSDAANECDDQIVIAHALLSPSIAVRGLIATHFRSHAGTPTRALAETMEASYQEMLTILNIMKLSGKVPVKHGAPLSFESKTVIPESEGADFIIEEALRDDPRPLFVAMIGSLTDLAAAYRKDPAIAERMTAVCICGGNYPNGGPEYNQDGDRIAANIVMESNIPLWQLPQQVYRLPRYGLAEMAEKLGRQGELGAFLFGRVLRFVNAFPQTTEFFQISDAGSVGVLLQQPWVADFETRPAPSITPSGAYEQNGKNRAIRVYKSIDQRALLEDVFAKFAAYARGELVPPLLCSDSKP